MGDRIVLAILVLAAMGILWRFFRIPPAFVITIRDGNVELRSGSATDRFLNDCEVICKTYGIRSGAIRGMRAGGRHVSLRFSREIGPEHHQRFRNVFCSP